MILAVVIGFIVVVLLTSFFQRVFHIHEETQQKKAGRYGEKIATAVIREILTTDDKLLTNVPIRAAGKQTELDNVIINSNGVFIIEVKNLRGVLSGNETDPDWLQTKSSSGGEFYQKTVKNPIKQVKRQIFILASLLKAYHLHVWVEGYVFFVEQNSPIKSEYVLKTQRDIERKIHSKGKTKLSKSEQNHIVETLIKTPTGSGWCPRGE